MGLLHDLYEYRDEPINSMKLIKKIMHYSYGMDTWGNTTITLFRSACLYYIGTAYVFVNNNIISIVKYELNTRHRDEQVNHSSFINNKFDHDDIIKMIDESDFTTIYETIVNNFTDSEKIDTPNMSSYLPSLAKSARNI